MLSRILTFAVLVLSGRAVQAQDWRTRPETVFVADRFIADTSTIGARITAKFDSAVVLARELGLESHVLTRGTKRWMLRDILVHVDFNGNGYVATWTVAGPRAVIESHVAHVRTLAANRAWVYDHGIKMLTVRCACGE